MCSNNKIFVVAILVLCSSVYAEPPPSNSYGTPIAPPISSYGTPNYNVNNGGDNNGHGDHGSHGDHGDQGEPKSYEFGYQVKDEYTGTNYNQKETSDGNQVRGEYRVALPDGRTQIVTYYADWQTGFHADVRYEGEAQYPDQYKTFNNNNNNNNNGGYNNNGYNNNNNNGGYNHNNNNNNIDYNGNNGYHNNNNNGGYNNNGYNNNNNNNQNGGYSDSYNNGNYNNKRPGYEYGAP